MMDKPKLPLPPFTLDSAMEKVRLAEDGWNSRDPVRVALASAPYSQWRNRAEVIEGRSAIIAFLTGMWRRELEHRLIAELWVWRANRIAVRFACEWHDDSGNWFRSCGNGNSEFDGNGLMSRRVACMTDKPIRAAERKFHWPPGRRPDDHPGLSALGC